MKWQRFVMEQFLRIEDELGQVLKGLSVEDLNRQPAPDCNSIGWLGGISPAPMTETCPN